MDMDALGYFIYMDEAEKSSRKTATTAATMILTELPCAAAPTPAAPFLKV